MLKKNSEKTFLSTKKCRESGRDYSFRSDYNFRADCSNTVLAHLTKSLHPFTSHICSYQMKSMIK